MEVISHMGKREHITKMADIILSEKLSEQGVMVLLSMEHPKYNRLHVQEFLRGRE